MNTPVLAVVAPTVPLNGPLIGPLCVPVIVAPVLPILSALIVAAVNVPAKLAVPVALSVVTTAELGVFAPMTVLSKYPFVILALPLIKLVIVLVVDVILLNNPP